MSPLAIGKVGTIERDRERDWRSVGLIDRERPEQPLMFRGPNLGRPLGDFRCFSSKVISAICYLLFPIPISHQPSTTKVGSFSSRENSKGGGAQGRSPISHQAHPSRTRPHPNWDQCGSIQHRPSEDTRTPRLKVESRTVRAPAQSSLALSINGRQKPSPDSPPTAQTQIKEQCS